ncbi:gibberellin-regulated protein 12 [Prunus persica]|uniref:gibberellin-regulated protein 12 n=1 Tax=Prunus persica TaxID=3760 RepID=UPI0009AB6F76|nr:gibberellin-regulated protein 12 [Prunus persica]
MARLSWVPTALFVILALSFAIDVALAEKEGSLRREDCPSACKYRCSETSHKKPCMFFCKKCCDKCLCVPSGTYGHKEECPCYNNWKTKEDGPKCP